MAKKNKDTLTPRQRAFVNEYLVILNATEAAKKAGYSEKTAYSQGQRLLKHVEVKAAIDVAQALRVERTEIDQDYVIRNLVEITERCMQKRPVLGSFGVQITDEDGNGVWSFNAQGANKALELIGRHLGMFGDKLKVSGGLDLAVEHSVSPAVAAMLDNLREVTR